MDFKRVNNRTSVAFAKDMHYGQYATPRNRSSRVSVSLIVYTELSVRAWCRSGKRNVRSIVELLVGRCGNLVQVQFSYPYIEKL
jgi:hypothetical protein